MLKAIFYARFHPDRGPCIIHQYPHTAIVAPSASNDRTLLSFTDISSYVIPPYELCDRPLSICAHGYRILGFPVSLESSQYERNRFTFNVCFVLDEDEDCAPWEQVVVKTAMFFRAMEEEDGILQTEERLEALKWAGDKDYPARDIGTVYTLLESTVEALNAFRETCVRVDDLHVLNLRLAVSKEVPPKIRSWDVPLFIRSLPSSGEWTWDLTLHRIHQYVDGVKHVQRIADLADVELKLVKKAICELLYHGRAILLDIFHFQAIYALTAGFALFVKDETMQTECSDYVAIDPAKNILTAPRTPTAGSQTLLRPAKPALVGLYRNLNPGVSLYDFCVDHEAQLSTIDIRRFITFGIIKGFLRRIHRHALAVESPTTQPRLSISNGSTATRVESTEDTERERDRAWKRAAFSSGWTTPPEEPTSGRFDNSIQSTKMAQMGLTSEEEKLRNFLDGKHCMDEICVSMKMSEKQIVEQVRSGRFGEVVIFCK